MQTAVKVILRLYIGVSIGVVQVDEDSCESNIKVLYMGCLLV